MESKAHFCFYNAVIFSVEQDSAKLDFAESQHGMKLSSLAASSGYLVPCCLFCFLIFWGTQSFQKCIQKLLILTWTLSEIQQSNVVLFILLHSSRTLKTKKKSLHILSLTTLIVKITHIYDNKHSSHFHPLETTLQCFGA